MFNKEHYSSSWKDYYSNLKESLLFPNEYVLRAFLGKYPNLDIRKDYRGLKVCDVGCGDGRNIVALNKIGLDVSATEINSQICDMTREKLINHPDKIKADIREGFNWDLPFEDSSFDYLLSWNACYYMKDENSDFGDHLAEFSRVMKKDSYFIASIPTPKCCTLIGAEDIGKGLVKINTKTKFTYLNGAIYRKFDSWSEIEKVFSPFFKDFKKARLRDDCFGLALDYFVVVCKKR